MTEDQEAELHQIFVTMDEYVERSDLENPDLGFDAEGLDAIVTAQFAKPMFGTELAQLLVTSEVSLESSQTNSARCFLGMILGVPLA